MAGGRSFYLVQRAQQPPPIGTDWDAPAWHTIPPLELTHFMGARPEHFPRTQARLLYDLSAVYVMFRVEDRYVRAVARRHQDPVYRDSCVEFFFTPGPDVAAGYFNLEMNCGGLMLLRHQTAREQNTTDIRAADLSRIQVAHSLPERVASEIEEPTLWTVAYALPVDLLTRYAAGLQPPAPGVQWRANFQKCADDSSHPHWLTWALIEVPRPDFHRPEFFGTIEFQ